MPAEPLVGAELLQPLPERLRQCAARPAYLAMEDTLRESRHGTRHLRTEDLTSSVSQPVVAASRAKDQAVKASCRGSSCGLRGTGQGMLFLGCLSLSHAVPATELRPR